MTGTYTGGLRIRLIKDNFQLMVQNGLDDLGWFDPARQHELVTVTGEMFNPETEIKPNSVCISGEDIVDLELELGSGLMENRWSFYVDVFAESEDLGLHLAGDIRDIIRGKFPSIGRTGPNLKVRDLSLATATDLFFVHFEDVDLQRVRNFHKPTNRFWWVVGLDLLDYYDTEDD